MHIMTHLVYDVIEALSAADSTHLHQLDTHSSHISWHRSGKCRADSRDHGVHVRMDVNMRRVPNPMMTYHISVGRIT